MIDSHPDNIYKHFFEVSEDPICVAGFDGYFKYINPVWSKLLGYTEEELLAKPFHFFIHPDDHAKSDEEISKLSTGQVTINFENRFVNKKGDVIYLQWSVTPKPKEDLMYCIARDITELKMAEMKLQESQKLYYSVISALSEGLVVQDKNDKILMANDSAPKILGLSMDQLLGKDSFDPRWQATREDGSPFRPEDHPSIITLRTGKPVDNTIMNVYSNDDDRTIISINSRPLTDDKGNVTRVVASFTDITERKKAIEELIKAKEKAEESDRLKTEFINNMSHEIRTPLNGILGFSEMLFNSEKTGDEQKQYIDIIHKSGNQLMHVIDEILEISELATKQVDVIKKEFCLNDLLMGLHSEYETKAEKNGTPLSVKKALSDEGSTLFSDEKKLRKILVKILENAIKFTSTGFIEIGYLEKNKELEIYVKDTGVGIREENQKSIFQRFSQEEKELSKNVGGLGLGLSIAMENTELLGGKLSVKSEKGKGATFFISIPKTTLN
ncbi:PAS domain-containing sensor histidine kinase [Fulvivirga lutimaris]|uniref:PAS domain-containing sensor histidine kinase n=1 Tax=Fulvivirga lutimaris TaxID=1819566 RepID=UPI0012BD5AFD|nr:PAS domain-containing sensor histidine kinase [Fulvivirga lutimaris]MTI40751.1 PAS domain-containing sensor histidine kinase [Fulvivirga lutimaris]